jgi:uncharacterized protein YndB with AHSA1/START domain
MEAPSTVHATLIFERTIPATADRVFAAYTDLGTYAMGRSLGRNCLDL